MCGGGVGGRGAPGNSALLRTRAHAHAHAHARNTHCLRTAAGWFSLNVPSGLTLYWFTNNLITTAQQLYLRRGFTAAQAAAAGPASTAIVNVEVQEAEKRPSGACRGVLLGVCAVLFCVRRRLLRPCVCWGA